MVGILHTNTNNPGYNFPGFTTCASQDAYSNGCPNF